MPLGFGLFLPQYLWWFGICSLGRMKADEKIFKVQVFAYVKLGLYVLLLDY